MSTNAAAAAPAAETTTQTAAAPPPAQAPPATKTEKKERAPAPEGDLNEAQLYDLLQRKAVAYSKSDLVPGMYRELDDKGKANPGAVANCVIALSLAKRLDADELMVMQNLYIVHKRPGWSATFLIASANSCGRFTPLRFLFEGKPGEDGYGCRAVAIDKASKDELLGTLITIGMSKAEGWYQRDGSKWKTMPEQMLRYRAAAFWVRAYAPELAMGLPTADEIEDVGPELRGIVAETEQQQIDRRIFLAAIAKANIERPEHVAAALANLGYEPLQNPERLPFDHLRALANLLRPVSAVEPAPAETVAGADGNLFPGVAAGASRAHQDRG